jgi:phosphatidate cytidylyltransferase
LNNFAVRTLTGAVYVAIVIGSILLGKVAFFALFAFISSYTLFEFFRLCSKGETKPQFILGIITSLTVYVLVFLCNQNILDSRCFFILTPLVIMIPIIEMLQNRSHNILNIVYTIFGIIYISIPFSFLNLIISPIKGQPELYKPEIMIGLFVIIWASDAGAYIFGRMLGKHKLIPKISPNKTWEGAIGGTLFAILISTIFFSFFNYFSYINVAVMTLLTVIAGTFGDLTESLIKRFFDVKDSGKIMPGHGGLFDRFDSLLFAAPIYYIFISLFLN